MNKITIDHFQRVQFLSALALSPAGQPAWVRTSIENDTYTGQLFVLDHDQPKQLTSGNESLFVWDDEKTLLFISSRGETPQPEAESSNAANVWNSIGTEMLPNTWQDSLDWE